MNAHTELRETLQRLIQNFESDQGLEVSSIFVEHGVAPRRTVEVTVVTREPVKVA